MSNRDSFPSAIRVRQALFKRIPVLYRIANNISEGIVRWMCRKDWKKLRRCMCRDLDLYKGIIIRVGISWSLEKMHMKLLKVYNKFILKMCQCWSGKSKFILEAPTQYSRAFWDVELGKSTRKYNCYQFKTLLRRFLSIHLHPLRCPFA